MVRRILGLVVLFGLCLAQAGCYLLQAAAGQWSVSAHTRPIPEVLGDPRVPVDVRAALVKVRAMRRFAVTDLRLPDNASYTAYADLGRRYVVWNVFATPEFSVQPVTWCFPVAGCVAYRGYFHEASARRFALDLKAQGHDVLVGGVAAYSTLGHFADPVLNTVIRWDDAELAGLVFHELAHQVAYARDDSAFNEAFATAVEREGVRRWKSAAGLVTDPADAERLGAARRALASFATRARNRLAGVYARPRPAAEQRQAKRDAFAALRDEYAAGVVAGNLPAGYERVFDNNASLLAIATYEDCVPGFERLLAAVDRDLTAFYARVRALAVAPRAARRAALGDSTSGSCR